MSISLSIENVKVSNPKVKDGTKVKGTNSKVKGTNSKVKDVPKVKVNDAPKVNEKKVVYLKDGEKINLHKNKIATNKAVKSDITSFSSAKKFCIANDKEFLSSFKLMNFDELTPVNLLPLRTEREKISSDKNGFSAWLFMSLVKRYYAKN